MADSEKLSLNQLIVTILAKEIGRLNVLNRAEDKMDELLEKINNFLANGEQISFLKGICAVSRYPEENQLMLVDTGHTSDLQADVSIEPFASTVNTMRFDDLSALLSKKRPQMPLTIFGFNKEERPETGATVLNR
jgi:hypothetical protein